MRIFNKYAYPIKSRLILSFLTISIIPLMSVVTLAVYKVQGVLREETANKLAIARDLKTFQVEAYLNEIKRDIKLIAGLPYVKTAIQQLDIGVKGQGLNQVRSLGFLKRPDLFYLDAYNPYAIYHGKYHAFFSELLNTMEYEDIWLVSHNGDIVYTYAKRDDFATNLGTGTYRDTPAAKMFKKILTDHQIGVVQMTDYHAFTPAGRVPVNFVGVSIVAEDRIAGVLIYELSMRKLNLLMQNYPGRWKTGETYLVGEDKKLRSKTRLPKKDDVSTYFQRRVNTQTVQMGLNGKRHGIAVIKNYQKIDVLSAYQVIWFDEFKWVLLAEVEKSEAFAAANRLRNLMIIIIMVTTLTVIGAGFYVGRSIAAPIVDLADTSKRIASGNLGLRAKVGTQDEIGHLAESFNSMTEQLAMLISSLELEITERKRAEEALQESEDHYRSLFENSPISLWEKDFTEVKKYLDEIKSSGVTSFHAFFQDHPEAVRHCASLVKVRDVNKATMDLLDATSKNDLKIDLGTILTEESMKAFQQWLVVLAKGGVQFKSETSQRTLFGLEKQVVLQLRVVPGYESSLAKVLVSLLDISERIKAEHVLNRHREHLEELVKERTIALNTAKEQAESASSAKSEFLARMSHEIRTPLNAITGLTKVVLKSDLTIDQHDYMKKIQVASKNLMSVINDILDFSKVEAGRMALENNVFEINQVMEYLTDLFSNRAEGKDLELIFFSSPKIPHKLYGDSSRLIQILTNLIENAIKFTGSGEIIVRADFVPSNRGKDHPVTIKFQVADTGIGIPSDVLPALFEPFTQEEGYLIRKHVGTGLGLAICKRLTELMGGRIWADSVLGRGSTFYFTALMEVPKGQERPLIVPTNLRNLKVLVADDSSSSRQMLKAILESFSFNVSLVDNGQSAIEELFQSTADVPCQLILLDWKMPGMNGVETARRIRELESHFQKDQVYLSSTVNRKGQIPIIILVTAYGQVLIKKETDISAVDSLLLKPVKASQLFDTIMTLFGQKELFAQAQSTLNNTSFLQEINMPEPEDITGQRDALLDLEGALRRLGGRKQVYLKVVQKFEEEFKDVPNEIRRLTAAGDFASASRKAHNLKGAAATIGAMALFNIALELEKALVSPDPYLKALLKKMENELKNTFNAIDRYLEKETMIQPFAPDSKDQHYNKE